MPSVECWTRYATFDQVRSECGDLDWLSNREQAELSRFRDVRRHDAWLAGRWLAKQLLAEALPGPPLPPQSLEVLSRDGAGRAVRPTAFVDGRPSRWCVSVTHSRRAALAGLSLDAHLRIGVDLTEPEDLDPHALVFWFSERERRLVRQGDRWQTACCWAVKEATFKACNRGESFVPRRAEALPGPDEQWTCRYDVRPRVFVQKLSVSLCDGHAAAVVLASDRVRPWFKPSAATVERFVESERSGFLADVPR
jgi:4'-phosphopantetheinyl transferase EntD